MQRFITFSSSQGRMGSNERAALDLIKRFAEQVCRSNEYLVTSELNRGDLLITVCVDFTGDASLAPEAGMESIMTFAGDFLPFLVDNVEVNV